MIGDTALAGPIPTSQVKTNTVPPSAAAASGAWPRLPSITISVVTTAICASWVSTSGVPSAMSARASANHSA